MKHERYTATYMHVNFYDLSTIGQNITIFTTRFLH